MFVKLIHCSDCLIENLYGACSFCYLLSDVWSKQFLTIVAYTLFADIIHE